MRINMQAKLTSASKFLVVSTRNSLKPFICLERHGAHWNPEINIITAYYILDIVNFVDYICNHCKAIVGLTEQTIVFDGFLQG